MKRKSSLLEAPLARVIAPKRRNAFEEDIEEEVVEPTRYKLQKLTIINPEEDELVEGSSAA